MNSALIQLNAIPSKISHLAVRDIPVCGAPDEVLDHHNLDVESIKSAFAI